MKKIGLSSLIIAMAIVSACSSSKKASTSASSASSATDAAASKGIIVPGADQLNAVKAKYTDATLQDLSNGYAIYTGSCTNCHGAKGIYSRDESRWTKIIDNMAPKAKLTDVQKMELTKYIMSVKATQPQTAK